ncbi:MAG: hypothetical protein ACN6I4_01830 [bacterium]
MKYFFIINIILCFSIKFYGQNNETINLFVNIENEKKIRISNIDNIDSTFISFERKGNVSSFDTIIDCKKFCRNNKIRVYLWVKRRYWFGWQRFLISEPIDERKNMIFVIHRSFIHKRKYRFVGEWVKKPLTILD